MLGMMLEQYGADVITAASASEALDVLPSWQPDMLVCDIGMPEEDGYSLMEKIRGLEPGQGATTPAIAKPVTNSTAEKIAGTTVPDKLLPRSA